MPVTRELGDAITSTLDEMSGRLGPWAPERRTLLTFDEREPGLRHALEPGVADRLAAIVAAYDRDGLFLANHVVD